MSAEALLFYSAVDDALAWQRGLDALLPGIEVRIAPEIGDPDEIGYAVVWKPPVGFFRPLRQLRLVTILGAGIDSMRNRTDLPDVPVARLSDPAMARMMAGYVLFAVLRYAREIPEFERAQKREIWDYHDPRDPASVRVGVLGLGELGGRAATELARFGFSVVGWSRSPRSIEGVECLAGTAALPEILARSEILVVLLPLTTETTGILGAQEFALLPRGAKFINVARGPVVDEAAMIAALRTGQLGAATLDVFGTEPLPPGHPLWAMENVLITPHLAAVANPRTAAAEIAGNIRRLRAGLPPLHRVDLARGY